MGRGCAQEKQLEPHPLTQHASQTILPCTPAHRGHIRACFGQPGLCAHDSCVASSPSARQYEHWSSLRARKHGLQYRCPVSSSPTWARAALHCAQSPLRCDCVTRALAATPGASVRAHVAQYPLLPLCACRLLPVLGLRHSTFLHTPAAPGIDGEKHAARQQEASNRNGSESK